MFSLTYGAKDAVMPHETQAIEEVNLEESYVQIDSPTTVLYVNDLLGIDNDYKGVDYSDLPGPIVEQEGMIQEDETTISDDQWDIEVEHKFPDPEFYEQMIDDIADRAQVTYGIHWPPTWLKTKTKMELPPEQKDQWIPIEPAYRTTWYRLLRDIIDFHETGLLAPYSNPNITHNERFLRQNHYEYKWVSWYVKNRLDNLSFGQAQILFDNEIPSLFVLQEEYYEEMDDREISTYYDDWYFRMEALCASCMETGYTKLMTKQLVSACCRDSHKTCDYCEWRAHCFHMFESYRRNSNRVGLDEDQMSLARC
jgi:hypothetical protein